MKHRTTRRYKKRTTRRYKKSKSKNKTNKVKKGGGSITCGR